MKKLLLILAACATGSLAQAQTIIDFNTPGQFASDFAGFSNYSQSATGGLDNTGSIVTTTTSQIAVYQPTGYDASAFTGFTIGTYFNYDGVTSISSRPVSVGVTANATDVYVSSLNNTSNSIRGSFVGTGTNGGLLIAENGNIIDQSSVNVDMTVSTWYYLEFTVGGVSGSDFTGVTAQLFASDSSGNLGASLKFLNNGGAGYTFANALTADTDVYGFLGGFQTAGRGIDNFDNFTVVVPEPTSAALLLGAVGVMAMRRRLRS